MSFWPSVTNVHSTSAADLGASVARLQRKLGYQFQHPELLQLALTHKSFAKQNNERLEFLGDAVLGYLVGDMLYQANESHAEDVLSLMRASLVRGTSLADIAREIDLAACLRLGSGERKSGGRQRDSILADAFEAVIGAIHEDGGIVACRAVVHALIEGRLANLDPQNLKDAKTRLQELIQGLHLELPVYRVVDAKGADHQREFTVVCEVPARDLAMHANASSRRGAEQAAAALMLERLDAQSRKG